MSAGITYAVLAYTLWGLFPLYLRELSHVPALEVVAHRTLWTLAFLAVLLVVLRRWAWLQSLDRGTWQRFGASAVLIGTNWLTYVWAVGQGKVLDASLGYFINPLINVALGCLVLRERLRLVQWVAIGLAAGGVAWLTWHVGQVPWVALVLALSFGFYGLLRKTAALGPIEGLTLEAMILSPLAAMALAVWAFDRTGPLPDTSTLLWLLGTGPLSAVSLMLFAAAARRIPLATLGLIQYLSPSIQFVLGVWLFHEPLGAARLFGFVLIWSALLLYSVEAWARSRRGSSGN